MDPPMASHRRRLMARPRPAPSYLRDGLLSTWLNEANSLDRPSWLMPMPLSRTWISSRGAPSSLWARLHSSSTHPPSGVNFRLLPRLLSSTCCRRAASPRRMRGTSGATVQVTLIRFLAAGMLQICSARSRASSRSNGRSSSSSFWASMRLKSRMSQMRDSRVSPDSRMVDTRSRCSSVSCVSASIWPTARMPFSGVRISWDMWARKRLLAAVAASACAACFRAAISASRWVCSWVTSDWMPT